MYVELPNTVEGLVHVSTSVWMIIIIIMKNTYEMVGEHTGKAYSLGQKVTSTV